MAGWDADAVALLAQQLDEPRLVLDLRLQESRCPVGGALAPRSNRAALGLEQHGEDGGRRRLVRQVCVGTAGAIRKVSDVAGQAAAELVESGGDELEVGPVLQARILADLYGA